MSSKNFQRVSLLALVAIGATVGCSPQSTPIAVTARLTSSSDTLTSPDDAAATPDADNTVDVKFMLRGYCYAGSKLEDDQALGGFGGSDNLSKKITSDAAKSSGKCYLLAQPTVVTNFG